MPPQEFELWTCSQGNTVLTTWPMRALKFDCRPSSLPRWHPTDLRRGPGKNRTPLAT